MAGGRLAHGSLGQVSFGVHTCDRMMSLPGTQGAPADGNVKWDYPYGNSTVVTHRVEMDLQYE